jgi:hypothetical protein
VTHASCRAVRDLVAAIWIAATELKAGTVYNVAEPQDVSKSQHALLVNILAAPQCCLAPTAQGVLNEHLGALFKIKTGFHGDILSNVAKVSATTWLLAALACPHSVRSPVPMRSST